MENMNDINHLDPNDEGLKAVMGRRFHDDTTEPAPVKKSEPAKKHTDKALPAEWEQTAARAAWEPVKSAPTQMERLAACAKSSLLFGGLCLLFFYWQQTGLMDPAAAMPSMLVCTLLTGLSIGKHAMK